MKCYFCDKDINNSLEFHVSKDSKCFCNFECTEKYYLMKIDRLTISEKAWHEEWFKLREIIGRLGLELLYMKHPSYRKTNA